MADQTQEDITSIVADLNRKIKEETESISVIYRGYDKKLLMQVDHLERIARANKTKLAALLETTKLTVQNLEYKRRMVAVNVPLLKEALLTLWEDPDRGQFLPVESSDQGFRERLA